MWPRQAPLASSDAPQRKTHAAGPLPATFLFVPKNNIIVKIYWHEK
jgi:hypothetical protein